jgi:hypothetical protein
VAEALAEPSLDTSGGDCDDFGRQGVPEGLGKDLGHHLNQVVGSGGTVD